jgi:hypothetical protein
MKKKEEKKKYKPKERENLSLERESCPKYLSNTNKLL